MAPQLLAPVSPCCGEGHLVDCALGWWSEVVQCILLQCVGLLNLLHPVDLGGVQPPAVLTHIHGKQGLHKYHELCDMNFHYFWQIIINIC